MPEANVSSAAQLSRTERILSAVVASVLFAGGMTGTFMTDNEIGVAAMIIVGAALAVLALTGQALRRIKIGENETEFFARVGRDALETAESETVSPSQRETARELVERASEATVEVPTRVMGIGLARAYERSTIAALKRVSEDLRISEVGGLDAVIDDSVGVDVKYRQAGRPPGQTALARGGKYRPAVEAAASQGLRALLILTNSNVDDESPMTVSDTSSGTPVTVRILQWTEDMSDESLASALQSLLDF